jgi:alcohol dehydrogenase
MTTKPFGFFTPTRIEYGCGKVDTLYEETRGFNTKRPLIVSDQGIIDSGILQPVERQLNDNALPFDVYSEVASNPTDVNVANGARLATEKGSDLIIAVGGGSVMDAAKAIGMLAVNGGNVHDYYGYDKMNTPGLPLITIPTTSGTGSEVTIWAVITDTRQDIHIKDSIGSALICPTVALVDPLMTVSMPQQLTAYTGMDALSHAIEGYWALAANPISDVLALDAIRLIVDNLPQAVFNGDNLEARDNMMLGSMLAGIAFSNSDTAAVHSLGEAIGGMYDLHHGHMMGLLLPYVMDYNMMACPGRFAQMAAAMDVRTRRLSTIETAWKSIEVVNTLLKLLMVPDLKESGVQEESFGKLAEIAMKNIGTVDNPRKMTAQGFTDILKNAFHGKFITNPKKIEP